MANKPVEFDTGTETCEELETLVTEITEAHHQSLSEARVGVVSASRQPEGKPLKIVAPGVYGRSQGLDLVLVFSAEVIGPASDSVKRFYVDNALAGWEGAEVEGKDDVVRKTYRKNASVPVHPSVLERHGPVVEDLRRVADACRQMPLPLAEAA